MPADGGLSCKERISGFLGQKFSASSLPSGWKHIRMDTQTGHTNNVFYSPVPKPKGRAIYISGLQSSPLAHTEGVEKLNHRGISVVCFSLIPQELTTSYIEDNTQMFEDLLFSEDSILPHIGPSDVPKFLMPHSTSAYILQRSLLKTGNMEAARKHYDGAICLNPFFDAHRASIETSRAKSLLHSAFIKMNRGKNVMETWIERAVMGKDSCHDGGFYFSTPKQGLIGDILQATRETRKDLEALQIFKPLRGFPQTFCLGGKDAVSCNATAKKVAALVGAQVLTFGSLDHSGALRNDELLDALSNTAFASADAENAADLPDLQRLAR